jgi:hypothetical protein
MVEEKGLDTLFNYIVRFIPESAPLPDEIISHANAVNEYPDSEALTMDDINWD